MAYFPFRGKKGARSFRWDVFYAMLREVVSGFNVAEGQKLTPGTDWVYKRVAGSQQWRAQSADLGDGAKGHWLGHSDAEFVVLYFHGGGYISAATSGHLKYQFGLQQAIRQEGHDFSIFSLSYTLAPKKVYPGQISQATAALRYLVEGLKRDPSTIIIAGDSAGGNLASALLLHLAHPHPKLPKLVLQKPLRAAVLISPWISFSTTRDSFQRNKHMDCLTIPAVRRASNTYIGPGSSHDAYSEPIRAPASWWSDVAASTVTDMLIWGGGGEVLIDSIRDFASHVQAGFKLASSVPSGAPTIDVNTTSEVAKVSDKTAEEAANANSADQGDMGHDLKRQRHKDKDRVTFVETPKMAHEEMILDYIIRIREKSEGARTIERWIDNLLKRSVSEGTFVVVRSLTEPSVRPPSLATAPQLEVPKVPGLSRCSTSTLTGPIHSISP